MKIAALAVILSASQSVWLAGALAGDLPQTPRIDSAVMSHPQPEESDPAVIWYDDFDGPVKSYTESAGTLDGKEAFGGQGRSMLGLYEKGQQGQGNRKVFFGDSPTGKVVQKGRHFDEIYWRVYVKHQYGWTGGGPDKLSRATSIVSPSWQQAMIAHVWSSGAALTLDPASGVIGDRVATTKYNDFPHLHWLGSMPASNFQIFGSEETGRWVSVEAHAKLNAPGRKDGLNQLWIDGKLECERKNLDWRGSYDKQGINAVFLETYWNKGSPVTQRRWIDNFVISTKPIGPVTCPRNPTLIKTPYRGPGKQRSWEVEIAWGVRGEAGVGFTMVWKSKPIAEPDRVKVSEETGQFVGALAGRKQLAAGTIYYFRVRQQNDSGQESDWSPWHQPIHTESEKVTQAEVTIKGMVLNNVHTGEDAKSVFIYALEGTPEIKAELDRIMADDYPERGLNGDTARKVQDDFTAKLKYFIDGPFADELCRKATYGARQGTALTGTIREKDGKQWIAVRKYADTELHYPAKMLAADRPLAMPDKQPLLLKINEKLSLKCLWVPPGKFFMGEPYYQCPHWQEAPPHMVTLTKGFYMAEIPVTQEMFEAVVGNNPGKDKTAKAPVNSSCAGMYEFCRLMSKTSGRKVRVPTAAEWEYAARVGTSNPAFRSKYNSQDSSGPSPAAVKSKSPNAWGFYDMLSSGWERVRDGSGQLDRGDMVDPLHIPPEDHDKGDPSHKHGHFGKGNGAYAVSELEYITSELGPEKTYPGVMRFRVVVEGD